MPKSPSLRRAVVSILTAMAVLTAGLVLAPPLPAVAAPRALSAPVASAALTGAQFDPGYIISDYAFYNANAMTVVEIQAFLDAKCGADDCINALKTTTLSRESSNMCPGAYAGKDNETTAAIIYKVQKACGISAKVILVTLQKEQGLLTKHNPTAPILRKAMGYGCSDTANCDTRYYGLFNQIYSAASQWKRYGLRTSDNKSFRTRYQIGVPDNVRLHPTSTCGTKSVTVKNKATTALYYYTPYTPNAAALKNLTAKGDDCSSYGNRNFWVYYNSWFGSPTTTVPPGIQVARLAGADRFDVSAKTSATGFAPGTEVAYIANGLNFADSLSAGPAAAKQNGPLLLVSPKSIPASVLAELKRLQPKKIVVVGGEASVSANVFTQLATLTGSIDRLGGKDRYEVSRKIAHYAFGETGATSAFIATGRGYPDALSAGAAAASADAPVLIIDGTAKKVDDATLATLSALGVSKTVIAGGPASVSTGAQTALTALPAMTSVVRASGASRFEVSGAINRMYFPSATTVYVALGTNYPDALSGAALAASTNSPLYVIPGNCVPSYVLDDFLKQKPAKMVILGGYGSLTSRIEQFTGC